MEGRWNLVIWKIKESVWSTRVGRIIHARAYRTIADPKTAPVVAAVLGILFVVLDGPHPHANPQVPAA